MEHLLEGLGPTWEVLTSRGVWCWQHMIVRDLNERCLAAEITVSIKTNFTHMIEQCQSHLTILFKLCRRRFPIKNAFAVKIHKAQKQKFNRAAIYPRSPIFSPHSQLHVAFSRSLPFDSVAVVVIEGHWQRTENDKLIKSALYIEKCFKVSNIYEVCLKSIRPLAEKNILVTWRDWNPNPLQSRLLAPPHT